MKASSAELGGDPCPGVLKYIDVIFKCGEYIYVMLRLCSLRNMIS